MATVFNYDSPVALKKKGDWDRLTALMSKMYDNRIVQKRIDQTGQ